MFTNKSFLTLTILGLTLTIQPSLSNERDLTTSFERNKTHKPIIRLKNQQNIHGVVELVEDLTNANNANRVEANQIAVILDVDGTLTDHSVPTPGAPSANTHPRDNAPEDVRRLLDLGVNLYISSAWNNFKETLGRLRQLGLTDELEISKTPKNGKDKSFYLKGHYKCPTNKQHYTYKRKGKVISARWVEGRDRVYYRQKALAPYIGLRAAFGKEASLEKANLLKKIIFADDSASNIAYFEQDIKANNLFPNADQIFAFELTSITHEPKRHPLAKAGKWNFRQLGIISDESEDSDSSNRSLRSYSPLLISRANISHSGGLSDSEKSPNIANLENQIEPQPQFIESSHANEFAARARYEQHLRNMNNHSPDPKKIDTGVSVKRLAQQFKH